MTKQHHFGPGSKFELDGDQCVVGCLTGATVSIRCSSRGAQVYGLAELFNSSGFKICGAVPTTIDPPLSGVPKDALTEARKLESHLLEAITGYSSGTSLEPAEKEPRAEYDPVGLTLTHRIACKASELGLTERAVWRMKGAYEDFGIMGLVDKRVCRF